jgi:hypothetical protein
MSDWSISVKELPESEILNNIFSILSSTNHFQVWQLPLEGVFVKELDTAQIHCECAVRDPFLILEIE